MIHDIMTPNSLDHMQLHDMGQDHLWLSAEKRLHSSYRFGATILPGRPIIVGGCDGV
jgi:hypothetical protein